MKINTPFFREIYLKIFISITLAAMSGCLHGQTITVGGSNWTVSVPAITEAGTNYAGTYESATNLFTLSGTLPGSFLNLLTNGAARISVHHTPTTWNSNLHLYAKRSGGTTNISGLCVGCTATINGGTTYVEIPQAVATAFFTINFTGVLGLGNSVTFSGINGQVQISGVSVTIPATTYATQIVFTIGPN
ncbi:hypothetical protein [Chryseobacterium culicis]|uniref:hypothetical protein n=1 Tax=Chryseobacterium culicis TaxID=680127 RepID=UPI0018774B98|nr:hypothetical protein [Chryseobacterium culicis]MBE4947040.1 hypothetical protein [Chryseobacterium culicis]